MAKLSETLPCHLCGGQKFSWGSVGGASVVKYVANGNSMWTFGQTMMGRQCIRCGNVQLFTDDTEQRRREIAEAKPSEKGGNWSKPD